MINGPDPDKDNYRFAINGQISRWKAIRLNAQSVCTADVIAAVDEALDEAAKPESLDDATHARDLADTLKSRIDAIEHILVSRAPVLLELTDPRTPPPVRGNILKQLVGFVEPSVQGALPGEVRGVPTKFRDIMRTQSRQDDLLARAKANAAANSGKVTLAEAVAQNSAFAERYPETTKWASTTPRWRFMPLHAEIADASAVLQLENVEEASLIANAADVRITGRQFDGRVRIGWGKNSLAQDAIDEARSQGLNSIQLSFELSPSSPHVMLMIGSESRNVVLMWVEVTKQTGPRTALPGLPVRVSGTMPPEAKVDEPCDPPDACATHGRCWTHSEWADANDGETPAEMQTRLAQAHAVANVYQKTIDPRDPARIAMDDLAAAEKNRTAGRADKPYAAAWSDDPKNAPGKQPPEHVRIAELEEILKKLYEGAGMTVESVMITSGHAVVVLNHPPRSFGVKLPPELKALLDWSDASSRK